MKLAGIPSPGLDLIEQRGNLLAVVGIDRVSLKLSYSVSHSYRTYISVELPQTLVVFSTDPELQLHL